MNTIKERRRSRDVSYEADILTVNNLNLFILLAIRSQSAYCVPSSNKPLGGPEVRPEGVLRYCWGDFPGSSSGSKMKLSVHMDKKERRPRRSCFLTFTLKKLEYKEICTWQRLRDGVAAAAERLCAAPQGPGNTNTLATWFQIICLGRPFYTVVLLRCNSEFLLPYCIWVTVSLPFGVCWQNHL